MCFFINILVLIIMWEKVIKFIYHKYISSTNILRGGRMFRILIIKRKHLYIALGILIALIIGIIALVAFTRSSETFSENMKYAYNKISAQQAQVLISQNEDLTILDVRKENEYLDGHIPNAILMPYNVMKKNYSSFEPENKYLIYCEKGKDSEKIANTLSSNGFSRVFVLSGGLDSWLYEIVK